MERRKKTSNRRNPESEESDGEDMKTLDDVMNDIVPDLELQDVMADDCVGIYTANVKKTIRRACEAMVREIVQGKKHNSYLRNTFEIKGYNDYRDNIRKNIDKFMGGEK